MSNWLFPERDVSPSEVEPEDVTVGRLEPGDVDPGTTVLVSGPAMTGKRRLGLDIVSGSGSKTACVVSTKDRAERVYEAFSATVADASEWDLSVVDCSRGTGPDPDTVPYTLKQVSTPADLTGIGIQLSGILQRWHGEDVVDPRVHLHSLSTLLMYGDLKRVFRFVHVITTRLAQVGATSVFTLDTTSRDNETVNRLAPLFEAIVEVREDDAGREFRVRGAEFGPASWTPY